MSSIEIQMNWKTISGAIISILTVVGMLIGAVYGAEERYVDASELKLAQTQMTNDIKTLQIDLDEKRINDRIQDYTDKKQYIQDKIIDGTATAADRKRINRYNDSIEGLQRELDRL